MFHTPIHVEPIGDGDYKVVRGGDVYRRGAQGIVPDTVRVGYIASASELCEWMNCGVTVSDGVRA